MNQSQTMVVALLLGAGILSFQGREARADDAAARQMMEKAVEALPSKSFKARVRMTGDYRSDRDLAVQHKVIDRARSTYIEVVAPEFLVGMRFLFIQPVGQPPKQQMRYIASKLPVLVARDTRAEPFLGSSFSLVDMVEPDLDAFTYQLAGTETVNGKACKVIEATPKDPAKEVYSKVVHCVDPSSFVVVRRRFFDAKGKAAKEWTGAKIEKVDGNWIVYDQRMRDLQRDVESRMEIVEIDYEVDIPETVFTSEYLTR